jgi:hypothetical protein
MHIYETCATVEDQGQVCVGAVPFAPGTLVEVTIREKVAADQKQATGNLEEALVRMKDLFGRVQARNTKPIGPLRREELYDRKVLR